MNPAIERSFRARDPGAIWLLRRQGQRVFRGNRRDCFLKLCELRPNSTEAELKKEGWDIDERRSCNNVN